MPAALGTYLYESSDAGAGTGNDVDGGVHNGQGCADVTAARRILMATEPLLAATRRSRGRAEAFARSLHSKLRSLSGSEAPEGSDEADYDGAGGDGDRGGGGGGGGGDAADPNANCHRRLCSSSSGDDVFFDMDLSPQSPEEEVSPSELEVLMVNSLNMGAGAEEAADEDAADHEDDCPVSRSEEAEEAARSGTSPQSDCSSDYFDPESFEDARADQAEETPLLEGVVKVVTCNGFAADSENHLRAFALTCVELLPTETAAASPPAPAPAPVPQQNGEQPQPPHTERRHPWNRVSHRHKAGTPEALRELQNLPPEEDSDAEDKPAASPSTRKATATLGKFVFEKSEQDKLQEQALEQIRLGKDLPEEFKNGLCPGPLAEAAAAAAIAETQAEAAGESVVEEDAKGEEQESEVGSEGTESEGRPPRVRRCSSLKTGKTPPGTPGRKKIVRFADVLGLDLADVRTFLDEIPRIPSSAYSDLSGTEVAPVDAAPPMPQLALSFGAAPGRCLVAAFQQPGGQPDFLDRVRERQVCLENAIVRDPGLLSIGGTVRVRNLDFHKSVHVRYTTDGWRSFADLQASYVANSCDGFSDKFTFVLYAAHTMAVGQRLEFAVRFQCKGQQFWDANGGANYAFECLPSASATGPCSMPMPMPSSPDDASWRSFY